MDATLQWFLCLCLERNLLQRVDLVRMRDVLKPDADALAYGEMILDLGLIADAEVLQALLDKACDLEDAGRQPPCDPFEEPVRKPISLRPKLAEGVPADSSPVTKASSSKPSPTSPLAAKASSAPHADGLVVETRSHEPITHAPPSVPITEAPGERVICANSAQWGIPDFSRLQNADEQGFREAMIACLLQTSADGASDLHLSAGARPFVRRELKNHYIASEPLSPEVAAGLNLALLSASQRTWFEQYRDLDFALPFASGERYRANLMMHKDGIAGTYRTVPRAIRTLEELGFQNPNTLKKLLSYHNGLLMVAGPVGSGKTTTLAALVHELNETRDDHLISVEEPIEIVHQSGRCVITQRGVGAHTRTFHSALKGALRQDPDIIVIGEMRDLETVEMAISASETGHLVIGTMHTSDAATTLNRLLDVFPPAQQPQIRAMVAESLRGIVCQRLLPAKDGGLVLATEVLLRNMAVSALIREGKTQGLGNIMETGKAEGMITMDAAVAALWRAGRITDEVALANIRNEIARRAIRAPSAAPESQEPVVPRKRGIFSR